MENAPGHATEWPRRKPLENDVSSDIGDQSVVLAIDHIRILNIGLELVAYSGG